MLLAEREVLQLSYNRSIAKNQKQFWNKLDIILNSFLEELMLNYKFCLKNYRKLKTVQANIKNEIL